MYSRAWGVTELLRRTGSVGLRVHGSLLASLIGLILDSELLLTLRLLRLTGTPAAHLELLVARLLLGGVDNRWRLNVLLHLVRLGLEVLLSELWRHNGQFSGLGFLKGLRKSGRLLLLVFSHLFLWHFVLASWNSGWDGLPVYFDWFLALRHLTDVLNLSRIGHLLEDSVFYGSSTRLLSCSGGSSSPVSTTASFDLLGHGTADLSGSTEKGSLMHLAVLWSVAASMRVDVMSFHVLAVDTTSDSGIGVPVSISMERRPPEEGELGRVGKPSGALLHLSEFGIEFLELACSQRLHLLLLYLHCKSRIGSPRSTGTRDCRHDGALLAQVLYLLNHLLLFAVEDRIQSKGLPSLFEFALHDGFVEVLGHLDEFLFYLQVRWFAGGSHLFIVTVDLLGHAILHGVVFKHLLAILCSKGGEVLHELLFEQVLVDFLLSQDLAFVLQVVHDSLLLRELPRFDVVSEVVLLLGDEGNAHLVDLELLREGTLCAGEVVLHRLVKLSPR